MKRSLRGVALLMVLSVAAVPSLFAAGDADTGRRGRR